MTHHIDRIRASIEAITRKPGPSPFFSLETPLFLLSILYGGVMAVRATLYRKGLLASRKLPCRVISIGNIVAGGTGKTPFTIFTARTLQEMGKRVVVISRGYRGEMEKNGGIVSDGSTLLAGPEEAGDEPYLMAASLKGIPVVVGADRFQAGCLAIERFKPDVIVLDDAFQHLRLKRDLDIVLLDRRLPLGNGYLLPRGRLREPVSALDRAHGFVFTRSDAAADARPLPFRLSRRPAFYGIHIPTAKMVTSSNAACTEKDADVLPFSGKKAGAFSGLADNAQFFASLKAYRCLLVHETAFDDHHRYQKRDLEQIVNATLDRGGEVLITTAKDWVKIEPFYCWSLPVIAVDVHMGLTDDPTRFSSFLSSALNIFSRHLL